MSLLTPQQFLEKTAADKAASQKAALDYEQLINQNDNLAGKIVAELSQTISDLDTLQKLQDLILAQGKENSHRINALLGFTIAGNIFTVKSMVKRARESIISKG